MTTNLGKLFGVIVSLTMSVTATATQSTLAPASYDCIIMPSETIELGSPSPGQLSQVLVDRGSSVTAGQTVATMESRLEQATLNLAELRAQIDTELNFRMAAFQIEQRTEKRLSSLAASDVATQHDKDQASLDSKMAAWRVLQAEEAMRVNKLEKDRAEVALQRRSIQSPINGVVVAQLHRPGEYVDSAPILRIVNLDQLHVEAILPMRLFGKVHVGMTATIVSDFGDSKAMQATIDAVDPIGDVGSGTFGARLILSNPQREIAAGVKCRLNLELEDPGAYR